MMNYIGPNNGGGFQIFYNGTEVASESTKTADSGPIGDGRIVVGRFAIDRDRALDYASVQVDELLFFNQALSNDDVNALYNAV